MPRVGTLRTSRLARAATSLSRLKRRNWNDESVTRSRDGSSDEEDGNWEPATAIASADYSDAIEKSSREEVEAADDAEEARFDDALPTRTVPADYHLAIARASEPKIAVGTEPSGRIPAAGKPITGPVPKQAPGSGPVHVAKAKSGPVQAPITGPVPKQAPITGPVPKQAPITGPVQAQKVPTFDDDEDAPQTSVFAQPQAVRVLAAATAPAAPAPTPVAPTPVATKPVATAPAAKPRRKAVWSPIAAVLGLVAGGAFGYFVLLGHDDPNATQARAVPSAAPAASAPAPAPAPAAAPAAPAAPVPAAPADATPPAEQKPPAAKPIKRAAPKPHAPAATPSATETSPTPSAPSTSPDI
jgi:hypothetical protein